MSVATITKGTGWEQPAWHPREPHRKCWREAAPGWEGGGRHLGDKAQGHGHKDGTGEAPFDRRCEGARSRVGVGTKQSSTRE